MMQVHGRSSEYMPLSRRVALWLAATQVQQSSPNLARFLLRIDMAGYYSRRTQHTGP